jgi:signal peptidase
MRGQVAVVVVVLLSLLLIAPTASPLRMGYVTSDSMAPTLEPTDGYFAVHPLDVTTGDIVVYWSSIRGEYVTHRVVDETANGYVTKGDNSDRTDQATGYPPVPRSAVVGEVLTVGGSPVVLPGLGAVVPMIQRYRIVVFGLLLLAAAALLVRVRRGWNTTRPGRTVLRVRDVVEPLLIVGVVTFVAVTPLGAASYQLTYVATPDGGGEYTIPVGETVTRNISVDAQRSPVTTRVIRAEGMTILDSERNGSSTDLTVSIPPPEATGSQSMAVNVYPYPAVLPRPVLEDLHEVHPVLANAASTAALFGAIWLLYRLALDRDRPIMTSRTHWAEYLGGG